MRSFWLPFENKQGPLQKQANTQNGRPAQTRRSRQKTGFQQNTKRTRFGCIQWVSEAQVDGSGLWRSYSAWPGRASTDLCKLELWVSKNPFPVSSGRLGVKSPVLGYFRVPALLFQGQFLTIKLDGYWGRSSHLSCLGNRGCPLKVQQMPFCRGQQQPSKGV